MAMLSLYLSYSNLGNYLSWHTSSWSVPFKKIETFNDDEIASSSIGCWQSPPQNMMEEIVQKMGLIARTRLANVCKSWNSFATRADIRNAPQLPWLVHPQTPNTNSLTFSSLSEGQVVNLELPKRFHGQGKFKYRASSKGWLIILQKKRLVGGFGMFLYNPISKARHQLPSLNTIPHFRRYLLCLLFNDDPTNKHAENFLVTVALSSPNISECIVAAIFRPQNLLGLCRPGDKSWTVIDIHNYRDGLFLDIQFSGGVLYGLVEDDESGTSTNNGVCAGRILTFGDDRAMSTLELKLIYNRKEVYNTDCDAYLLESTTNKEMLLIYQFVDILEDDDHRSDIEYERTSGFLVYKVDLECGNFHEVRNLGDQIIFVAQHSSSLSFPASEFNLQGNCIYFATSGYDTSTLPRKTTVGPTISREIGIFCLDDGKIKRPFPSVDFGGRISSPCQLSWFCPSF